MSVLELVIIDKDDNVKVVHRNENELHLYYEEEYQEGDKIVLECQQDNAYLMLQLDDAIGENFVFIKNHTLTFEIPFGEKKICYSPKSFAGDKHLLSVRLATEEEIAAYKNLTLNKYDQHENINCFPHASANVETRGESVFAAKNAINGNRENHSHGIWPYESWGINQNPDAKMKVEFGRKVAADKILMYTRADFPHDAWWEQVTVTFSDGSEIVWDLEKTDKAHEVRFEKKIVEWVEISKLIKAEDPSPFPALSQFEVYGTEA